MMKQIVAIPENYEPSDNEDFMNDLHREYFRLKLEEWRNDVLIQSQKTVEELKQGTRKKADMVDIAAEEVTKSILFKTRDRQLKLIRKIENALLRIENGRFGYCNVTGNPISINRLIARPIATLCLDAQEKLESEELYQKVHNRT